MAGGIKVNRKQQNNHKIKRVMRKAKKNNLPKVSSGLVRPTHKNKLTATSNPKKRHLLKLAKAIVTGADESKINYDDDAMEVTTAASS